ncbi:MAG: hypothetical protein ACXADY_23775 [Candidatus Hodarchaeales archaeon]|jgi:hypothetical protein
MIGTLLAGGSLGLGIAGLSGKKKKYKMPPMPRLGPEGKWAQETLYADIEKGLTGGRFLPSAYPEIRRAYQKAYPEAQWRLRSYLNRFVPRRDVRVRNFAGKMLDRSYYGTLQDLKEAEQLERKGARPREGRIYTVNIYHRRCGCLPLNLHWLVALAPPADGCPPPKGFHS